MRVLLGTAVLVVSASLALNAYLLVSRERPLPRTKLDESGLALSESATKRGQISTSVRTPFQACAQELQTTRQQLEKVSGDLEARIGHERRFAEAQRDIALEHRVNDAIQRALSKGRGLSGDLECRGDTCQVRIAAANRADAMAAWDLFTKDPDIKSMADSFMMNAGEPVIDVVSGKGSFEADFYVTTRAANDFSPRLEALLGDFSASSVATACYRLGHDSGSFEVKLSYVAEKRNVSTSVGGSLAGTAIGRCLRDGLQRMVDALAVPEGITWGHAYGTLDSPHST